MARIHAIAVLACIAIGAGTWLLLATGGQEPPPPLPMPEQPGTRPPGPDRPEQASRREATTVPAPPPAAAGAPDVLPPPLPVDAPQVATLRLRVTDAARSQPVARFHWRWRGRGTGPSGDGSDGHADVAAPRGERGELLIEAPGYQPFLRQDLAIPAAASEPQVIEAQLDAAATATGIALQLRDTAGTAIGMVRVDAFGPLRDDAPGWHLAKPLWSRRTGAADGSYVLPDLAPGRYGIRVMAVDGDGPLPLLAWRREFTLTGSNGFVEDVVLEPACVLELDLVDVAGNPIDPGDPSTVALSLRPFGGELIPRRWIVAGARGPIAAVDALPAAGTASPEEPLPAGTFTLSVSRPGQPLAQQDLTLPSGQRSRQRIVLR